MTPATDHELDRVVGSVRGKDPLATEERIAGALHRTFDYLLDGLHTGRWHWKQLNKTERTHAGTLVEINLQREFQFADGLELDFQIEGVEVDCKYSQESYGWMIPPEAVGKLCIVISADYQSERWSLGVVRPLPEFLGAPNRDQKRKLLVAGYPSITWIFEKRSLPPNVFLRLKPEQVGHVLDRTISGQKRVNRLFETAIGLIVTRSAVATAAQQDDYMKRARANGGARQHLKARGIVIFGHEHHDLVRGLKLPVPRKGELVSARLVAAKSGDRQSVIIDRRPWRLATEGDPEEPAPPLPRARSKS